MAQIRWLAETGGTRGPAYAQRFAELAATGQDMHGEARFLDARLPRSGRVLDAGCGTGRVGVELDRRGHRVVGVDADRSMLAEARAVAPHLRWIEGDLQALPDEHPDLEGSFEVAALVGNVLVYVEPGTEAAVIAAVARCVVPGGLVVAGFTVDERLPLPDYDRAAAAAGLEMVERYATWDGAAYADGDYAVTVHRRDADISPVPSPRPVSECNPVRGSVVRGGGIDS